MIKKSKGNMASKQNEQICATAGDVAYFVEGKRKAISLAKLIKVDDEYTLNFYKRDGTHPKHKVKLKLPGHNFILSAYQRNDYLRCNLFYFGHPTDKISPYLSFEVGKSDWNFGDRIKKTLQAFSHHISVIKDGSIEQYVLHITPRRLCITNNDCQNVQFLVFPKDITGVFIELKCRENVDVPISQAFNPDFKFYELIIRPGHTSSQFPTILLLIVTVRIAEIYQTFKSMLNKEFLSTDIPEVYEKRSSSNNTYTQPPSRSSRIDKMTGLPILSPSLYDELYESERNSNGATSTHEVSANTKYGSKRRHGIYTYIQTVPPLNASKHTYEYVDFSGKKEKSILQYSQLNISSGEPPANNKMESLNFYVSVFATPPKLTDCWCLCIIITKYADGESFKAIKDMEESAERHLLSGCRDIRTESDLLVDLEIKSKHFKRLDDEKEHVSINDLQTLTSSETQSWIVIDMLVEYCGVEKTRQQFIGKVKLKPISGGQENNVIIQEVFPGEINNTHPSQTDENRHRIVQFPFRSYRERKLFRELLDVHDPLGKDWKYFADLMGLSQHEIRVIGDSHCDSYTEEVITVVERQYPDKCRFDYIRHILEEEMGRKDVLEVIHDGRAVENELLSLSFTK